MKLIANISMMFTEVALAQRLDQARAAGFEGVEIQFPDDADIAPLQAAIRDTGLPVVLINVPRGPGDAVGLASLPGEEPAFARAVETCARQAKALGARKVNAILTLLHTSGRPVLVSDVDIQCSTPWAGRRFPEARRRPPTRN